MVKELKSFVLLVIILVSLVTIGILIDKELRNKPLQESKIEIIVEESKSFAECITDNNSTMYGVEWCSHCQSQKKEFGESFESINYIDCDQNKEKCIKANISGYPTWIIKGEYYMGSQPLSRLAELTGCELDD